MAKVLVTGASGFIGGHLVKSLEKRGDEVVRASIRDTGIDWHAGSLDRVDYVFHLGAYGNMANQEDVVEMLNSNVWNFFAFLMATKDVPYKAFVNVSSSSVLLPHETMYSATKAGAERLCKAFVDEYHKPIITVRPASVYGDNEADFRFIPTVFRSCLRGDEITIAPGPKHDWIYVDDIVDGLIKAADKPDALYEVNLSTGIQVSNREVVSIIEDITGKKANIAGFRGMRSYDTLDWKVDNTDAKEVLGWKPTIQLREGLEKYYKWYKELA